MFVEGITLFFDSRIKSAFSQHYYYLLFYFDLLNLFFLTSRLANLPSPSLQTSNISTTSDALSHLTNFSAPSHKAQFCAFPGKSLLSNSDGVSYLFLCIVFVLKFVRPPDSQLGRQPFFTLVLYNLLYCASSTLAWCLVVSQMGAGL